MFLTDKENLNTLLMVLQFIMFSSFIITLATIIFYTYMFKFHSFFSSCPQSSQVYITPSCLDSLCSLAKTLVFLCDHIHYSNIKTISRLDTTHVNHQLHSTKLSERFSSQCHYPKKVFMNLVS